MGRRVQKSRSQQDITERQSFGVDRRDTMRFFYFETEALRRTLGCIREITKTGTPDRIRLDRLHNRRRGRSGPLAERRSLSLVWSFPMIAAASLEPTGAVEKSHQVNVSSG